MALTLTLLCPNGGNDENVVVLPAMHNSTRPSNPAID